MDYIFYKIYKYYQKKDSLPLGTALLFIFILQVSFLFLFGIIINLSTNGLISAENAHLRKDFFWTAFISILILLLLINITRYAKRRKVALIEEKFKEARINIYIKTWHIFLLPIAVILFAILLILISRPIRL